MTAQPVMSASSLLTSAAVRERAQIVLAAARVNGLIHFTIDMCALPTTAAYVADTIRTNYPDLNVPPHSRWRHLSANGRDWAERLGSGLAHDRCERMRQRIELAVTSVLLDAGAGANWRWRDPVTGRDFGRSEGLALASLEAFRDGLFSSDPTRRCRADAAGLATLDADALARVFQVSDTNPLLGVEGRAALLRRLGEAIAAHSEVYGEKARVGHIADHLEWAYTRVHEEVPLPHVLTVLLKTLGGIWPGRLTLDGMNLGDTWRHQAIGVPGPTRGLMPFHKLSQWLTYSLIEPLQEAGISVTDLDGLTGLAEYRNGGLFIDMGVLVPRDPALATTMLMPDQEAIVEWRALTIALLDEIAPLVRAKLGVTAGQLPLASILEGGTWAAGRRIAAEKRPGGGPPLTIVSDGTVF